MNRATLAFLLLCLLRFVSTDEAGAAPAGGDIEMTAVPDRIRIGTFYSGTGVRIDADVPDCDNVVMTLEGEDEVDELNRKGKVGIIWLNVARVTVRNAPSAYIIAASDRLAAVTSRDEREKLGLGFDALESRIEFDSNKPLTGKELEEFIKLKKHAGTYKEDIDVVMGPAKGGRRTASAALPIPADIPAGEYTVRSYCFIHQELIATASMTLPIEKVGLPNLASTLAYSHAAVYGILAIVIAMVVGISMGALFSMKSGH
ncbi:MAG: TIGR02186 family protein [bacterium]